MFYPLKFNPILKKKVWGGKKLKTVLNKETQSDKIGESWELSALPKNHSIVAEGRLKGLSVNELISKYKELFLGKRIYEKFGETFPLLIKFIDAADDLSVQVHPDDATAQKLFGKNGKNELWYILDSEKNAELILGLKKSLNSKEFRKAIDENTLTKELNIVKVKRGDVFFIPAGRIHAIKKGVLLAEIQQPSDVTYRIYDWNRKGLDGKLRDLHIEEACKVADLSAVNSYQSNYIDKRNIFVQCELTPFFTVNILKFNKEVKKNYSEFDCFIIYICTKGNFQLLYSDYKTHVTLGETVLLPAELDKVEIIPEGECELLEVYI